MPGRSGCAALALGTALLAALGTVPAFAGTEDAAARACMDETVRLQREIASIPLPVDAREEIERTLVHAHEEAKGGNATACADAVGRAHRFVEEAGGRPAGGVADAPAQVAPDLQPPPPEGVADPDLAQLLQLAGLTEVEGIGVATEAGDPIGDVGRAVRSPDGARTLLVLEIGGFLGIGEHRVALPLAVFEPGVGQLTLPGYDRAALERLPAFEETRVAAPTTAPETVE